MEAIFTGKTIFVLDDDEYSLLYARQVFERSGAEVNTASSGLEALSFLRETKVDLAVFDFILPDMTGLQVLDFVRHRLSTVNTLTPVLMCSGERPDDTGMAAGERVAYLGKPYTIDEMMIAAARLLGMEYEPGKLQAFTEIGRKPDGLSTDRASMVNRKMLNRHAGVYTDLLNRMEAFVNAPQRPDNLREMRTIHQQLTPLYHSLNLQWLQRHIQRLAYDIDRDWTKLESMRNAVCDVIAETRQRLRQGEQAGSRS